MDNSGRKRAGQVNSSRRKAATTSQVVRKRELDRNAQRASRNRTRSRIAFLEEKTRRLEAVNGSGQVAELLREVEKLRQENSHLRSLICKIRGLTESEGAPISKLEVTAQHLLLHQVKS